MTALRRRRPLDIWPAFVDATASLLMVVVFALLLAVLGHLVLSTALTGRDEALAQLSSRINKLAEILSLEQAETARLEQLLSVRTASLDKANEKIAKQLTTIQNQKSLLAEREATIGDQEQTISEQIAAMEKLQLDIEALTALRDRIQRELEQQLAEHETIKQKLQEESELNIQNIAQIELLNQQQEELRQQLSAISSALEIAEKDIAEKQTKIDELGERLNTALANKALLLQKYRSEFFGRLRDALSQYPNIRIEGDRFVFPSELLFESGSDKLGADGKQQVKQLATTLNEISKIIPDDIDWEDEVRLALEERASFSPDALTGMEASLRFAGRETLQTKIFGRLSAWQNWIFQRPNAVGADGALTLYGTGKQSRFRKQRV